MLKVLIVEDEQHNRGALSEILVKQGYSVSVRENGRLAFELCLKQSFDVVLSDIRMPEVSGIELFELLKQAHRGRVINDMPYFIFMTAYGKLSEAVELMKKGPCTFLSSLFERKS